MILESGEYYQKFYKNSYQGYWAAFLVESFLAISAMLYFEKRSLLNFTIRLVMIPLFLVVVGGASLKIVSPMIDKLAQAENKSKLQEVLQNENKQSLQNLERLKGQKVNTAIEIRRQRQSMAELKASLKSSSTCRVGGSQNESGVPFPPPNAAYTFQCTTLSALSSINLQSGSLPACKRS